MVFTDVKNGFMIAAVCADMRREGVFRQMTSSSEEPEDHDERRERPRVSNISLRFA